MDIAGGSMVVAHESDDQKTVKLYSLDEDDWTLIGDPWVVNDETDNSDVKFGYKAVTNGERVAASYNLTSYKAEDDKTAHVKVWDKLDEAANQYSLEASAQVYSLFGYGLKLTDQFIVCGAPGVSSNTGEFRIFSDLDDTRPHRPLP